MSKIYCVGELLVDMIGESDKTLKQNPGFSKRAGGAPANVAVAASRLGADVSMIATVGKDEFGHFLIERLDKENVSTENIFQHDTKTTLAFAALDEQARPQFSFYRHADERIFSHQFEFEASENDIVHVGSLPLTHQESAENILEFLQDTNATVSFDPNIRKELMSSEYEERLRRVIQHVDLLTAAEEEVEFFGGLDKLREQMDEILVTRGSRGAELFTSEETYSEEAHDVEVVDTTGAGDALTGAYLSSRSSGRDEQEALRNAVKAASVSITSKGAMEALPHREELE